MTRGMAALLLALPLLGAIAAAERTLGVEEADVPQLPGRLSETGLYGAAGTIDPDNRPFSPQYPLWSDGASKARWVYLPPGARIDVTRDERWEFPVGTKFWKEFTFSGRRIETRMLWKATRERWEAASYVWNAEGTDAMLAPDPGVPGVVEIAPSRRHSVPSRTDCAACHGPGTEPLGFNPLQLSTDRDPHAIHGEPLGPDMVTLKTLVEEDLLSPARPDFVASPPRIAAGSPTARTALGYLAANCGSCHDGRGQISVSGLSFHYADLLTDGDAIAQSLVGQPTRWQVPGRADGTSVLVDAADPHTSALLVRMRSRRPSSQMPPLGSVVRDEEAVEAMLRWIEHDLARVTSRDRVTPGNP